MFIVNIFNLVLSACVLLIASIFDLRTREIPDELSYGFLALAFILRIVGAVMTNVWYIAWGIFGALILFLVFYLLYRLKQVGGGDVKLFTALGMSLTLVNTLFLPLFLLTVLFLGAVYAIVWGGVLFFQERRRSIKLFVTEWKRIHGRIGLWFLALLPITIFFEGTLERLFIFILVLTPFILFSLYAFIRSVELVGFIKTIPLSSATEGDWLASDVVVKGKILCSAKEPCLEKRHLELFRKAGVKNVTIKIGIPFVPVMFLSLIFMLLFFL